MRAIAVMCFILGTVLAPLAFGAAAKVASCPPGKQPSIQTLSGMFTVHVVCDRVMFEIPPKMLNRDILANTEFAALSTGSDFVAPGSAVDNRVIRLTRLGNKVYLEDVRYEIWARQQSSLQRGVEAASLRTALRATSGVMSPASTRLGPGSVSATAFRSFSVRATRASGVSPEPRIAQPRLAVTP